MKPWGILLILQMTVVSASAVEVLDRSNEVHNLALMGGVDCGIWISARESKSLVSVESYVQGLVNGFSWGAKVSIWDQKPVTREQFFLWMDKFCRENPLENVLIGSNKFADEMTGGLWHEKGRQIYNLK